MRTSIIKKYEKISSHFVQHKGYLGPFSPLFSGNSLYPFILGVRDNSYYYDLIQSLPPMKSGLNVLENLLLKKKKIIFLSGNNSLNTLTEEESLLFSKKFLIPKKLNIIMIHYSFCSIQQIKDKNVGLMLTHNINEPAIFESEGKTIPFIGVGCPSISGVTYPFNINLENSDLANWYLYVLFGLFRQSLCKKKKNEI